MKKILCVVSVCILVICTVCACTAPVPATEPTDVPTEQPTEAQAVKASDGAYYLAQNEAWFKSQGRTVKYSDGIGVYGAADGVEFNADCDGDVTLKIVTGDGISGGEYGGIFLTVYVDGVRNDERYHINTPGEHSIVIASGLEKGEHSFGIYRQTELGGDGLKIVSVEFDGQLLVAPVQKDYFVEFIGDSLTSGFGNMDALDFPNTGMGDAVYEDATQSYGFLVAKEMDWDYSIVAIQGMGVFCGPQSQVMSDVYNCYPLRYDTDKYYYEERHPDVVVINMLANDWETKDSNGATDEQIFDAMRELVALVRQRNPDAKIILATSDVYQKEQKALVEELGGKDAGYYYRFVPSDTEGHGSHPSLAGHRATAKNLKTYIQQVLGIYKRK